MTKHFSLPTVILCAATMLAGCLQNNNQSSKTEPLPTDSVHIALQYPAATDTSPLCQVAISLAYPAAYQDETRLAALHTLLTTLLFGPEYAPFAPLSAAADTVANRTLEQLCAMRIPLTDEDFPSGAAFATEIKAGPIYNNGEFLVYHRYWYSYEGGAHGMYTDTYDVIYLPTLTRLTLDDIFAPGSIDKLNDMLIRQLLEDQHLNSREELNNAGYFDAENIKATENFAIDNHGITWTYNPYEIGCYAIGETRITLSYEQIGYCIAEDSPIYNLIDNRK